MYCVHIYSCTRYIYILLYFFTISFTYVVYFMLVAFNHLLSRDLPVDCYHRRFAPRKREIARPRRPDYLGTTTSTMTSFIAYNIMREIHHKRAERSHYSKKANFFSFFFFNIQNEVKSFNILKPF